MYTDKTPITRELLIERGWKEEFLPDNHDTLYVAQAREFNHNRMLYTVYMRIKNGSNIGDTSIYDDNFDLVKEFGCKYFEDLYSVIDKLNEELSIY